MQKTTGSSLNRIKKMLTSIHHHFYVEETAGGNFLVRWVDGPSEGEVREKLGKYENIAIYERYLSDEKLMKTIISSRKNNFNISSENIISLKHDDIEFNVGNLSNEGKKESAFRYAINRDDKSFHDFDEVENELDLCVNFLNIGAWKFWGGKYAY